jgi:hypothetical protein
MSNFQALVLGMMLAWTPSLIALGCFLLRAPVEYEEEWESTPGVCLHSMKGSRPVERKAAGFFEGGAGPEVAAMRRTPLARR